ncbi:MULTISPECIES: inositol monophosphatase family protein [Thiorhodovibrio]|uniref:inositol monophosphatase family protein n=1 Tax=Thiorhodovibrio TaxID=61593 RepID=UPI002B2640CD|nr:inositol monophosphatase [Thiorhodovibrio litoralis]WPL11387.1 Inositol-1-monophosphatase [Thiorhodovibrio litoralis]
MISSTSSTEAPSLQRLSGLVREVGQTEILPTFGRTQASAKADGSLITEVDLAVQRRLIAALGSLAPEIPVLGEEMTHADQLKLLGAGAGNAGSAEGSAGAASDMPSGAGSDPPPDAATSAFWALDPLDGTSNFVCGFPAFAISLALFRNGQVELGVIYDPIRDECFAAQRGQGAWLNGAPLVCQSSCERLADAMALMDFKRIPPERMPALLSKGAFRSQRNLGSVALDWCWLAAGRAQVYLHGGQRLWDYAAGQLIAAEAGVKVRLLEPGLDKEAGKPSLEPRLAMAAANQNLFAQWWAFVGLPWHD